MRPSERFVGAIMVVIDHPGDAMNVSELLHLRCGQVARDMHYCATGSARNAH